MQDLTYHGAMTYFPPDADDGHHKRDLSQQRGENLPELVAIMQRLLSENGCPWDREQTLQTLKPFVIEEAHEVVDAIDEGNPSALADELGDLLLQIVFQAELARNENWFGPNDVVHAICAKMVRRHPHVFGDAHASDSKEVLQQWEQIKAQERQEKNLPDKSRGMMDGIPRSLPALQRATQMSAKAARVGFDWPDQKGARAKVDEELRELDLALLSEDTKQIESELGDVLFALVNVARRNGIDAEAALRGTTMRFASRFGHVEKRVQESAKPWTSWSLAELDREWDEAKRMERSPQNGR